MNAAWAAALDEYERRLDAFEELLSRRAAELVRDGVPLAVFEPPVVEGRLAGEQLTRAIALLERSRELEARGEQRLAEAAPPTRLPPVRRFGPPRSRRIDTSA